MAASMAELEAEGWVLQAEAVRAMAEQYGSQLRSVLLDTDLKDVGANCLPLRQRMYGTLILQLSSMDDIGESRGTDHGKRMLRIQLTDGHSTVTAVEYRPIAFLSADLAPGTKVAVRETKVQNGILLLDEHSVKILGGHVPLLYEGWEIQRKYSGSARRLLRGSLSKATPGPPPFLGLKVGARRSDANDKAIASPILPANQASESYMSKTGNSAQGKPPLDAAAPSTSTPKGVSGPSFTAKDDARMNAIKAAVESNPEVGPAQNHAAAQKLLDRKVDERIGRRGRMRRGGRSRNEEDEVVLTLDEWEAKRSGASTDDVVGDEAFARRLQQQLDLGATSREADEAEQIRLSMFNFSGGGNRNEPARGRGRGRRGGRRHA